MKVMRKKISYIIPLFCALLASCIQNDIPYPRTQETKMTPRFLELKNEIWSQVYQEYLEVRK